MSGRECTSPVGLHAMHVLIWCRLQAKKVSSEMFTTEFRARHKSSQVTQEYKGCNLAATRQGRSGSSGTERLRPFPILLSTGRHPWEAQGSTRHTTLRA
jgi:hypothetical protein